MREESWVQKGRQSPRESLGVVLYTRRNHRRMLTLPNGLHLYLELTICLKSGYEVCEGRRRVKVDPKILV